MRPWNTPAQNKEAEHKRKTGEMAQKLPDRETASDPGRQSEVEVLKAGVRNPSGLRPWANLVPHMGQFLQGGKNGRLMSFFF